MNSDSPMAHDEARELLPWLINDSLRESERDRVREHASLCVICRRDFEELEQIQASVRKAADEASVHAPDMRRINARIDALIEQQESRARMLTALGDFFRRPWRIAFVAQSIALVALVSLLLWPQTQGPEFTTLTNPDTLPAGDYIRVVFDPDLESADVAAIVDKFVLEIVSGPSARGVATLRYAPPAAAKDRDATIALLLDETGVLFAQPVRTGEP